MTDSSTSAVPTNAIPRSLFIYSLLYGGLVVLAGVLGNKQVALGPLAVEAGIFPFLMLVALSSCVAEIWGQQRAQKLVLYGFIPLVTSMLFIILVYWLPADSEMDPARLSAFETIMGQSPRLMAAGIVAYGTSQLLNVTIFSALRGKADGKSSATSLAVRGAIASALSQIVDTLLFVTISFYGVFPIGKLMAGQMAAKVVLSLVIIPFVIQLLVSIARQLDAEDA